MRCGSTRWWSASWTNTRNWTVRISTDPNLSFGFSLALRLSRRLCFWLCLRIKRMFDIGFSLGLGLGTNSFVILANARIGFRSLGVETRSICFCNSPFPGFSIGDETINIIVSIELLKYIERSTLII